MLRLKVWADHVAKTPVGTLRAMPAGESDDEGNADGDATGFPDHTPASRFPNPLDRLWTHPSELQPFVSSDVPVPAPVPPRTWAVGVASALAASALTVLVLVAFGAIGERTPRAPTVERSVSPGVSVDHAREERVALAALQSVVIVRATVDDHIVSVSGVAIASDRVLAPAHVVAAASAIAVAVPDGAPRDVRVLGVDPDTDLALLQVPRAAFTPAPLAPADLSNGQTVIVVGWNFTRQPWIEGGLVTAQNAMVADPFGHLVAGLVQTDRRWPVDTAAALAGGVLVDVVTGAVVGLLVDPPGASAAASGGTVPGYAVPADVAQGVLEQLAQTGKVVRGYLGVQVTDETGRSGGGATITAVLPESPAIKADLATGDVIVRAGGTVVRHPTDLLAAVRRSRPGDPLRMTVVRSDGARQTKTATLAVRQDAVAAWW
jgi:S1-C subfamily serine protease